MSRIQPWLDNRPIVEVSKQLYRRSPRPGEAAVVTTLYTGPGLQRMEIHAVEAKVDTHSRLLRRFSPDNGRTWSDFEPTEPYVVHYAGREFVEVAGPRYFDPAAGVLVEAWLRQVGTGRHPDADHILNYPAGILTRQTSSIAQFHTFTYSRVSRDLGRTWSAPQQLRYEEGEPFDPADPLKPAFLQRNQAYFGNNIIRLRDGSLLHAVCGANAAGDPLNEQRYFRMGGLCFRGRWDAQAGDYVWTAGRRIEVDERVSSEGLNEPVVAELRDGRVLVVWRATATRHTLGRKWYSLSADGGQTLSGLHELTYDDGGSFYSPSSIHHLIRHSRTGKLYWLGNISRVPPIGNWPRYPLVIAEVDEDKVALRRDTVTVIDDRRPDQSEYVEFSNFWLLEDRESGDFEITLTAYGEDPENVHQANCYRYTLRLV